MMGVDCIAALKALGELNRMRIVRVLLKEQLCVNAIAERLALSQYEVSRHLRVLREAGLVETERHHREKRYSVAAALKSRLSANKNILDLGCCTFRSDQLPK